MITNLFIAVLFGIIILLCYVLRRQLNHNRSSKAYQLHLAQEINMLRSRLYRFGNVAQSYVGGVDKRITEHGEIMNAITARAPHLFDEEPGLKHWLSANSQFYTELRKALAE